MIKSILTIVGLSYLFCWVIIGSLLLIAIIKHKIK